MKKSTDLPRDGGHLVEDTVVEHRPCCQYIFSWGLDFPRGCVKESASKHRRSGFDPWIRKIPWRRKWKPIPVFLPGKSNNSGVWWATVHGVANVSDTAESLNNKQQLMLGKTEGRRRRG